MDILYQQRPAENVHPVIRNTLSSVLFLLFVVLLLLISADLARLAACLGIFVLLSLPGQCAVYPLFHARGRHLEGFVWGILAGTGLSALIISVIVSAVGWNFFWIAAAVIGAPGAVLLGLLRRIPPVREPSDGPDPAFTRRLLVPVLIVCTFFFLVPFSNLGAHLGNKYVYAWLFGHDFINRAVHAVSASRGLPLESYHFGGETLSYYWLAYIYPALLYNLFSAKLGMQKLLQVTAVCYSLAAASGLVFFLAWFARSKKALLALVCLAFLSYSYMDLYEAGRAAYKLLAARFWPQQSALLADFAGVSHSLYRFFLVEPQGVLAIGVILLLVLLKTRTEQTAYTRLLAGLLLGILFGIEATVGLILLAWYGAVVLKDLAASPGGRMQVIRNELLPGAAAAGVYGCLFALRMYSLKTGQGALVFAPNPLVLLYGILYFPIEYGPAFVFGAAGLVSLFRARGGQERWVSDTAILLAVSLFFVFFIVNPTERQFGLLKATRIIPLCLLLLTAYWWRNGLRPAKRTWLIPVLLLIAAPGYVTDITIASDVTNPGSTFIRESDLAACEWIKSHLPADAVVQAEPNHPGVDGGYAPLYYYSLIPVFAERPTGIGEWKVSSQEHARADSVGERFHALKRMFATEDVSEALALLRRYRVGYVYTGDLEKKLYPSGMPKFREHPSLFELVYAAGGVEIYRVLP